MPTYNGKCKTCGRLYSGCDRHYCSQECANQPKLKEKYLTALRYWFGYYRNNGTDLDNENIRILKNKASILRGGAYLRVQEQINKEYKRQALFWAIRRAKKVMGYITQEVDAQSLMAEADKMYQ